MKIFIVIPAYNEGKRIGLVLETLVLLKLPVVVVDDGSCDKTYETVKKYPVTLLRHKVNLGKGAAIKTGFEAAFARGAEGVIMMDSDGQHKVEDIPRFVEVLEEGRYDLVLGSRNLTLGAPLIRFLGNKFASLLISVMFGIYVSDLLSGYRAMTKKAFRRMKLQSSGYGIETEMIIKAGREKLKYIEIPIEAVYHDKFKGVTILDAVGILLNVLKWKVIK